MEEETPELFIVGWTPQRTRYGFGYSSSWSPAGLVRALKEDIVSASGSGVMPARGRSDRLHRPSGVGAVFNIYVG
jgi:hypothetical protein